MPNDAPDMMTRSEYARHRGVTPSQISHWTKQGRIVFVDDRVSVDATDRLLAAVLKPRATGNGGKRTAGRPANPAAEPAGISYARAQTRHRELQSARAELDLRARQGELTETAAVARGNDVAFGQVRDMLDALPARLASRLAAENDVRKCHALIEAECRAALTALAETLGLLAASQAAPKQ